MVRCFTVFVLIVTVLSANFSRLFIYAGFEANQKFIAATLCENKDKPQLHCLGKCYLKKKIKQAEDKEKSQERQSQKYNFQEALVSTEIKLNSGVTYLRSLPFPEPTFHLSEVSGIIFQPPRV